MINRATGEVSFQSGLHIVPHRPIETAHGTRALSLKQWHRHILGTHPSEHGTFEVEALSAEEGRILIVLLAHQHSFYEPGTPEDAERRTFHEGVISKDLAGQREFSWGEVLCRLETSCNKDWLVIAYTRETNVPLPDRKALLNLLAHEPLPDENA
jgi:hypothetical protein